MNKIKTFEDACLALSLDPKTVVPDFSLFPEKDRKAMVAHAKLVLIASALNEGWIPDWENANEPKYYPWFKMGSPSGSGFSYGGCDRWLTVSDAGSRLCFKSRELAVYAGRTFEEIYKDYCVSIKI